MTTFWAVAALTGSAIAAWLGVFGLLWKLGRTVVRGIAAHVQATAANTAALATLTDSLRDHIATTNRAVGALDRRVSKLERTNHHAA